MSKWTKQTYEMVAEVLRDAKGEADPDSDAAIMTLDSLTGSFTEVFRRDNLRFDEGRFRRAAGGFTAIRWAGEQPRRRPAEVRVRQYARRVK